MKKEHLLILAAGVLLGALISFILMKQNMENQKLRHSLQAQINEMKAPQQQNPAPPPTDPAETAHRRQVITEALAAAKASPSDARPRIALGNTYYDMGNFAEAIVWYKEARRLAPKDTNVIVDLGVSYRNTGESAKAIQLFDEALQIDPAKKQALFNKVIVYANDLHNHAKALETLDRLEQLYPGSPDVASLRRQLGRDS
ncbi:MAG: tetratricopeptide repeat protein [Acidobacteriota bacterium]